MQMGRVLMDVLARRRFRIGVTRLLLVTAMLASSLVMANSASAQAALDLNVQVSCLAQNGRLDISFVADRNANFDVHVGSLAARPHVATTGETVTEVVTGRRDGPISVDVRVGGIIVAQASPVVDCDPDAQTRVDVSCLGGMGRLDAWVVGPENGAVPLKLEVLFERDNGPTVGPREVTLFGGEVRRMTTTGRPDDTYTVVVRTASQVTIFEDRVSVSCSAPGEPVTLTSSCLGQNGRLDFDLYNDASTSSTFSVTVPPIADRTRTLAPGGSARISYTGRPDKPIAAAVSRDGATIWQQTVTPACDPGAPEPEPDVVDNSLGALPSSVTVGNNSEPWVSVRLREAAAVAAQPEPAISVQAGTPLDDATTNALFARLPELVTDDADQVEFRPPETSLARPSSFDTVNVDFPPPAGPPLVELPVGPLEVLRFQPEGDVASAPYLSVTFNQAMVPIGAIGEIEAGASPVNLSPAIPGRWIWIGTRTLRFEYDGAFDRLPGSTQYSVNIPAGTTSATGNALAQTANWTFRTDPVVIDQMYPWSSDSLALDQIFVVRFDQLIDEQAVLTSASVRAGGVTAAVRLATDDEIAADPNVARFVDASKPGRFIALRAIDEFPTDTPVRVEFAELPSAEGPLRQPERLGKSYRTYGPFEVEETRCGFEVCRPFDSLSIDLTNQLDSSLFDPEDVTISPDIPGVEIRGNYRSIWVRGATVARKTYTVTLPADLTDIFGQTITGPRSFTFEIGDARPSLSMFGGRSRLVTLDPFLDDPVIEYSVVNLNQVRIRAYAYEAADWPTWTGREQDNIAGTLVYDETIATGAAPNAPTALTSDLGGALDDHDFVVVVIDPNRNDVGTRIAWVQATQLGVDVTSDNDELRAWVTDLRTGEPVAGAEVANLNGRVRGTTDAEGLAVLPLTEAVTSVVATKGGDRAMLPRSFWGSQWRAQIPNDQMRWFTFDDRQLYRPGETISVKGWIRRFTASSDAQLAPAGVQSATWRVVDAVGNELASGQTTISTLGGFDLTFDTPTTANLGQGRLILEARQPNGLGSNTHTHWFELQEFRRPEFEVNADVVTQAPHFAGSTATVEARANYFAGGALPDALTEWTVRSAGTRYSPPGWDRFSFGAYSRGSENETYTGTTNAMGIHALDLDFTPEIDAKPGPVSVTAAAAVTDVNRQRFEATTNLLVHPADRYVGMRTDRAYVRAGESLDVDLIVTDLDGNATAGVPITVEIARVVGRWASGSWTSNEVDTATCNVTSGALPVACSFDLETGGRWVIRANITDAAGRPNLTEVTRWASGGRIGGLDRVERQTVELIADRDDYQPGDTANVLVVAPFDSGHGLLTLARNGIVEQSVFELTGGTAEIAVPIDESMMPNLWLQVEVVGSTPRSDDESVVRPAYAGGTLLVSVPPTSKALSVEVTPAATELSPGSTTSASVRVTGADGLPVAGAEIAVVAVDEAVLALTDFTLPDPQAAFWQRVASQISTVNGRASIVLSALAFDGPEEAFIESDIAFASPQADSVAGGNGRAVEQAVAVRSNFDPLAVFAPEVRTSGDGSATVTFDLPDNLTRYRLYAVAVSDADRFGAGESSFTARLPLMARPSAPRFANFGDAFELPVVIQNQTDVAVDVDVALRAANLAVEGPAGRRVRVPANDRVEVRFPTTTDEAGTARFQVIAVAGAESDAAEIDLPVLTPATSEAFATYGVLDDGEAISQPIDAPDNVFAQFGGLEVGTSTTALHSLSDAVLYLSRYPYRSANSLSSRILAISALDDVLPAFGAEGLPSPDELRRVIQVDIEDLIRLQNADGGFSPWSTRNPSFPWASVHATHALVVAEANGYAVPDAALANALGYLESIETRFDERYLTRSRDAISAYALHVRDLSGDRDVVKASALFRSDLDIEALGWIWPVVDSPTATEIRRLVNNRVIETPSSASFATSANEGDWLILRSDRRTDAILLDAMIRMNPGNDLIPKVVTGLQAERDAGRWNTAGENAFVLLAFERYFETFEATDPDLVARVWLGNLYAAEHDHPERSTDRVQTVVPMSEVLAAGDTDIVVQDDGVGRLYWRLGLNYAPTDLDLEPLDRGFVVQRTYTSLDDPQDVTQDADGTWRIKAGADVQVDVTMVADSVRTHVALIDRLPAGLEAQNPSVALPQPVPFGDFGIGGPVLVEPVGDFLQSRGCFWCGTWFDHQNLRDDRAEAFRTYLWAGTYDYSYVTRATTIGRFVVPPAKAEMIHEPEVFGRSGTDIVIVED